MWKLRLWFCYAKEDVRKAFSPTIIKCAFHCHLRYREIYTLFFLSKQFYPCSSEDSKIHLHSFLENLMDVFFSPLHFPVLSSFNPPDGPLNTSSTLSFGLQSCPYTGGFKTWFKVCWKGFWENIRITKRWFFCLYLEWTLCALRTRACCTLTPTEVFITVCN